MNIQGKLPDELISIENSIFTLVSDTYDSRRSDAKRVREIFENVVFKDQADVETLTSLGNSERVKFIKLREFYKKSKCQLAFKNLVIEKLRIFDETQQPYTSLKDEPKSSETSKSEIKLEAQIKPVIPAFTIPAAAQKEQRVSQFASKRIQAPAPQKIEIDSDEALALQLQAEWLEEEEKANQKKARTSNEGAEVVNKNPSTAIPAAAKSSSRSMQQDEIEIYKEKEDIEPVEPMDDFALAQKLMDEWNTSGIDPSDALKKKSIKKETVPEFMDEMEAANARAIAQLLESDVLEKEQADHIPAVEAIDLAAISPNSIKFEQEDDIMTDAGLSSAIEKFRKNVYLPFLGKPDENLSRRITAEAEQMEREKMDIPGVGKVQRTPTAHCLDSKSEPNQKLYLRDRAIVEPQTQAVRFECSLSNEITIKEDCQIEVVDIQFGTIHILKSNVKIHNASECTIYVKHNSKVEITGASHNNTIKYSEDSELIMSLELWNKNTITH